MSATARWWRWSTRCARPASTRSTTPPCRRCRTGDPRMDALRIDIVTLFPDACAGYLDASIVGRARRRGLVDIALVDPRAWAGGRHRTVDDRPFGGGPGMVLAAPPIAGCLDALLARQPRPRLLMTSPGGAKLDQRRVESLA